MTLDQEFSAWDGTASVDEGNPLKQTFAVIAGTKPCAIMAMGENPVHTAEEITEFAEARGAHVLSYHFPWLVVEDAKNSDVEMASVRLQRTLFIYRDPSVRDAFIELERDCYAHGDSPEYHTRLGRLLGYTEANITEFHAREDKPLAHPLLARPLTETVAEFAYPAVYDMLKKDPILGPILPPRAELPVVYIER